MLAFEGDAVGAVLGAGASAGRHHQSAVVSGGSAVFGDEQLAGRCGEHREEQAGPGFGGVHMPGGAVQITVPSANCRSALPPSPV